MKNMWFCTMTADVEAGSDMLMFSCSSIHIYHPHLPHFQTHRTWLMWIFQTCIIYPSQPNHYNSSRKEMFEANSMLSKCVGLVLAFVLIKFYLMLSLAPIFHLECLSKHTLGKFYTHCHLNYLLKDVLLWFGWLQHSEEHILLCYLAKLLLFYHQYNHYTWAAHNQFFYPWKNRPNKPNAQCTTSRNIYSNNITFKI